MSVPSALTTCDQEPIHLLGAIQPIGCLLCVNGDWVVVRASENVRDYLGVPHEEIVGRSIESFLPVDLIHDLRGRLHVAAWSGAVERLFAQRLRPDGVLLDIAVHESANDIVLEFEPSMRESGTPLSSLRTMIAAVERQQSFEHFHRAAARQVRGLTGFDRVMVYRFDTDGSGEVVAEAAAPGLASYLGLRYPATDIPVQARALYERNFLRLIVNVDAEPVPITPSLSPEGRPLDLSLSTLRSVSPIHLEYLRNMGVRSSMSISIIQHGRLWGLIACHHRTPKRLSLELRSTAELFGQIFSYALEVRERDEEAAYDARGRDIEARLTAAFGEPFGSAKESAELLGSISDYIPSDGIGIYRSGEITLTGLTPTREEFTPLVAFLNKTASGRVFSTHCLSDVFPPAADYVMRAAGILAIPISRAPRDYLVFFRRELVRTVTWAGEPAKPEAVGPNGVRLTPRKSFEAWRQIVQNQCTPWAKRELRAAEALRVALVEMVLRMTEARNADRVGAEQHQEILIAELNHRVRNILGLVRGLITQGAGTASDIHSFVSSLEDRIRSLARAHDLLTSSNWRPTSLHAMLRAEIESDDQGDSRIALVGPDVLMQPKACTAMALVLHELVTNARKYGALTTPHGRIAVTTASDALGNVTIAWRETDGPVVTPPTRRGFGSMILEQAVPFEVNGESRPQFLPLGFVLDIMLPAAVAQCDATAAAASSAAALAPTFNEAAVARLLKTCLVVEDNLFIALDVEDMLRRLGAEVIEVAKSVTEALGALSLREFTFALLDVSLGFETSLPVARALQARNIPFVFGTGYGEKLSMNDAMAAVPIVTKPYHREALIKILAPLLRTGAQRPSSTQGHVA